MNLSVPFFIIGVLQLGAISTVSAVMDWDNYHNTETIVEYIRQVEANYSSIVTLRDIGATHENRSIFLLEVGKGRNATNPKPAIFIEAGIHPNEWISPAVATYFIQQFVVSNSTYYDDLLSSFDFYILPLLNPDGYEYAHTTDRMWRKNRRPDPFCEEVGVPGVNLNINFGFMWDGGSRNNCDNAYGGPGPFSEPETKALADFILAEVEKGVNFTAYFSLHSYGQFWLLPWAYQEEHPDDYDELKWLAMEGVAALTARFGTTYEIMTPGEMGEPGGGTSMDWAKGSAFIKYTQTLELRDQGEYGQLLPANQIKPCAEETLVALEAYSRALLESNLI